MTTTNESSKPALVAELVEALRDMLSGWRYIRQSHGDLYGVGWDRAQNKAEAALEKAAESEPADIKTADGGPAFHFVEPSAEVNVATGMTLRDYFAAKALVGLLAEPFSEGSSATVSHLAPMRLSDEPGDSFARASYLLADAMLKARG